MERKRPGYGRYGVSARRRPATECAMSAATTSAAASLKSCSQGAPRAGGVVLSTAVVDVLSGGLARGVTVGKGGRTSFRPAVSTTEPRSAAAGPRWFPAAGPSSGATVEGGGLLQVLPGGATVSTLLDGSNRGARRKGDRQLRRHRHRDQRDRPGTVDRQLRRHGAVDGGGQPQRQRRRHRLRPRRGLRHRDRQRQNRIPLWRRRSQRHRQQRRQDRRWQWRHRDRRDHQRRRHRDLSPPAG